MNAHDAVIGAVLAALRPSGAGGPGVTTGPIGEEIDLDAVPETTAECVSVSLEESNAEPEGSWRDPRVHWNSRLLIECYARVDALSGSPAGRKSRLLHQKVYARLMSDKTLGGVAAHIEPPQLSHRLDLRGTRIGCCIGRYVVVHSGDAATLEA